MNEKIICMSKIGRSDINLQILKNNKKYSGILVSDKEAEVYHNGTLCFFVREEFYFYNKAGCPTEIFYDDYYRWAHSYFGGLGYNKDFHQLLYDCAAKMWYDYTGKNLEFTI